jgi:type IV pilus assembly protein PilV
MDSRARMIQRKALKPWARPNGFTLIEVLIALVILSVPLLALAGLMAMTSQNTSFGGHMTEASTMAQDKLEELRATLWNSIPEGTREDRPSGSTGIQYNRSWTAVTDGNLKTVSVIVNWTDRTNHFVRLLTVISR